MNNFLNYILYRFSFIFVISVVGGFLLLTGIIFCEWFIYQSKVRRRGISVALDIDKSKMMRYWIYISTTLTLGLTFADVVVNVFKMI